jgi:hypothetical protein
MPALVSPARVNAKTYKVANPDEFNKAAADAATARR